jgi:hypothetical protein
VITMEHAAVSSLPDLTFDTPFVLPVRIKADAARKVHVRLGCWVCAWVCAWVGGCVRQGGCASMGAQRCAWVCTGGS